MGTLVTLPNVYCSPADVADYLGVENVELRLDDQQLATLQTITCTVTAAQGATVIDVSALQAPLLIGAQLSFYGAGTAGVVVAVLTAVAQVGDTTLTVQALPAPVNANATATDTGVNVATAARMAKGCNYATSRIKMYCANRYDDSQLATSVTVNEWATYIAAKWVAKRRGQSAPAGIMDDYKEAMDELKQVRCGGLCIPDIGTRTSGWPFITASTLDVRYDIVKSRVEPLLSEGTPTQYGQYVDWNSIFSAYLL